MVARGSRACRATLAAVRRGLTSTNVTLSGDGQRLGPNCRPRGRRHTAPELLDAAAIPFREGRAMHEVPTADDRERRLIDAVVSLAKSFREERDRLAGRLTRLEQEIDALSVRLDSHQRAFAEI